MYRFQRLSLVTTLLLSIWTSSATADSMEGPTDEPSACGQTSQINVSFEEAERIALKAVPGGRLLSVEREYEWGRVVYEVDVLQYDTEWEVVIDATDGKILDMDRD